MKKNTLYIILLIFILIIIPVYTVIDSNRKPDFSEIEKDDKWEFVKDRVTKGYVAMNIVKFTGPILYELHNASEQDSLAIKEIVQELRTILPNKTIESYSVFKETEAVRLGEPNDNLDEQVINIFLSSITASGDDGEYATDDGNIIGISRDTYGQEGFFNPKISFLFVNNSSFDKRKQLIKYAFYRKLTLALHIFNPKDLSIENEELKNSFFASNKFNPVNSKFSHYDKFFLQKIYSDNLVEELGTYLYDTYPWRYATYLLDRSKAVFYGMILSTTLGVMMLFIGFGLFYMKTYKYAFFKYLLPILVIFLCWNCLSNLYFYIGFYEVSTNLHDYLVYFFLGLMVVVIIAFILFILDKIFIRKNMGFAFQLILKVSFVALVGCLFVYGFFALQVSENMLLSIYSYEEYVKFIIFIAVCRGILIYLNHFSESLVKQKDLELSRLKEVNAQAEVKLLQSQINPHFLYNALNSIASLAHKNADKTEKMALSLSDLFKYTINRKGKKDSTIGDEVEMVKNYLEVEQIRFDDRLSFNIDVDTSLENTKIPMFLIQPLIENAVKHGISKVETNGIITLRIHKSNLGFTIIVEDNGPDFPDGLVSGHGLQTVFDLLRLTYKNKASISWENTPAKQIKITIENE